jgi:glycosyltransferase involved in cell wall biosynthesis
MIRLFLNGLAASAGGGLTYLRNVVPKLSAKGDVHTTIAVSPSLRFEFQNLPNISFVEIRMPVGALQRFWREQSLLPGMIQESGAAVLISAGNFALRKSSVPQILLSRNSLYLSGDFFRDLRNRKDYRLWLDTRMKGILAKRSIQWADCTVAPSLAFAEELRRWSGKDVTSIHHGFDEDTFFRDKELLSPEIERRLKSDYGSLRLLFVSHYNYYRNFETLLRAVPLIQDRLRGRKVELFLTCRLRSEETPGGYRAESAAALIKQLGITENVVELGSIPYTRLHRIYRACDIYATPSYAETFAHPLVEAMASGLPVVASDLPVHREICNAAAEYFSRFSAAELAGKIVQIASSDERRQSMKELGRSRASDFSWTNHVDSLVVLARQVAGDRETK